jgi:hypothetical protein
MEEDDDDDNHPILLLHNHKADMQNSAAHHVQKCRTVSNFYTAITGSFSHCRILTSVIQSGPKKCIHSLLINIFGINLNEISVSG